ncbi:type IV toxin-antitoxin system AbiEi family antitoxin domain-containing protein [Haloferax sp. S1W]|uniref:type IV toxin-antitoxin system AbiEi family antitoxin domain-containing protein n=1 Tax=Haloferax sp. S1W TaxID=3377110 RepID=UPI0037CAC563
MIDDPLRVYNLVMGLLSIVGLVYLVYAQRFALDYRRFIYFIVSGFLLFSVGGPLADLYLPALAHLVHGLAAVLVIVGLYNLIQDDMHKAEWTELLFRDPGQLRQPDDWMVPMDDEILELFQSSRLVLTPTIVAHNIGRSREEVNRRLTELTEHGLVERPARGKYRITKFGEQYLQGTDPTDVSVTDSRQSNLTMR